MTHETFGRKSAASLLLETVSDLADLIQKEMRLARAEIAGSVATNLRAGVWMIVGGLLGLCALVFALEGAVLLIASYGIAMHRACFIVAGALAVVAVIVFAVARAAMGATLAPRVLEQVRHDIRTAREHIR